MGVLDDIRKGTEREVSRKEDAPAKIQQAMSVQAQQPSTPAQPVVPQQPAQAPVPPKATQPVPGNGVMAIKRPDLLGTAPELPKVRLSEADKDRVTRPTSYVDILRHLNPYTPPTAEEVEKDRRRQRSREAIAAIGDGVRAISNLVATANYAPNAYHPNETMLSAVKARHDKLDAERKANADAYLNAYMKAKQLDAHNDEVRDAMKLRREQAALEQQLAQAKQSMAYQKMVADLGEKEANRQLREKLGLAGLKQRADALAETKRHNRVSESEQSRRTGIMATRAANSEDGKYLRIYRGEGKNGEDMGGVEVREDTFNDVNIGHIYNQLPESIRAQYRTKKGFGPKATYQEPSPSEMRQIIGQNINDPNVQRALLRLPNARIIKPQPALTSTPAPAKPAPAPAKPAPKGDAYKGSGSKGKAY